MLKGECETVLSASLFNSIPLLSVLRGHSGFFIPATTANDLWLRRIFYPRFHPLHLFSYLNSWERASISLFNVTTGSIFITSLVWRGPRLGIEPGASHTQSQHYTTRLSRWRYTTVDCQQITTNLNCLLRLCLLHLPDNVI